MEILKKEAKEKDEEHKKAVEILKKEAKEREEIFKKEVKEKEEEHKKEVEILKKEAKEKEEEHKKEVEILKKEAKEREEMLKKEIKEYIISQFEEGNFDDEEIQKIKNFFKAISPEKEIINLIEFNNKLILIKTSVNEKMDKEKEKFNLISQINNSIGKVRKEEILKTIKALFPNH